MNINILKLNWGGENPICLMMRRRMLPKRKIIEVFEELSPQDNGY